MSKQKEIIVNEYAVVLQSVSPQWYMENIDRYGRGKNTPKYVDELIKNVVVAPSDIAAKGLAYFNEREDVSTPSKLVEEIETFLASPVGPRNRTQARTETP